MSSTPQSAGQAPAPLLSLLWHLYTDQKVRETFSEDPMATMKSYNISSDAMKAIMAAGEADEQNDELIKAVAVCLVPELKANYFYFW